MKNKVFKFIFIIMILFLLTIVFIVNRNNSTKSESVVENVNEDNEILNYDENKNIGDFEWKYDTPENNNVDIAILEQFNNSISSTLITSTVVIKNGKIINEYYKEGYNQDSVYNINSCSKSITSTLVGIAIDKGYIENVDIPISNYFPEILDKNSEQWKQITIKDLLTNTSGIQAVDDNWREWRASENWIDYILNNQVTSNPGTTFSYSTGNTHLLSAIIQKATGMKLDEFGKKYLFEPIGIKSVECREDEQGISDGGNGYSLNAHDMAKFAMLYLNNGVWEGEQIVSSNWINEATTLKFNRRSGTANYGYQWWVRTFGEQKYESYFAQGHGNQFIFVVPKINLIVTFTSNYNDNSKSSMYWQYVNNIVNACEEQ